MERTDGYPGLKKYYNLSLNTVELDPGLMYAALKEGKVDVICGFSTDGRIPAFKLRVLSDDKRYFPPYHAAPLVRGETIRRYPILRELFLKITDQISDEKMRELNFRADYQKKEPSKIARDFLVQLGFEVKKEREGKADIIIGSKNFTEQYILAHIFKKLIEGQSDLIVELKTGLAGTKICLDALINGEIDMYPEYTGTGLHVILKADKEVSNKILRDEKKVYEYVKNESKKRYDLEWLQPLGFNNTYALMMRESHADELNIETISGLEHFLDKRD
jgi:osmoprotectant transport system permease protein